MAVGIDKYKVYEEGKDFVFETIQDTNTKGTRVKKIAVDTSSYKTAYFKYEKYNCSESCSEKMCYEIAKILGYPCAHIELAKDRRGIVGILNYLFIDRDREEHHDAIDFINKNEEETKEYYTIENIKKCLDDIDEKLFYDFLKIMVFDALVGETDRHAENWGITIDSNGYRLSPLYDNGDNLLRDFKNESFAEKYYNGIKLFSSYVFGAWSLIYKDDHSGKYKSLDLVAELYRRYPEQIKNEILNLKKLTPEIIEEVVNKIPDDLLTKMHKKYIINYLKERKRLLEEIIG